MARTKQTPRKSTGGKAPRKQLATKRPLRKISLSNTFRTHIGPFPLSNFNKSNNETKPLNENIINIITEQSTLCRDGIWQVVPLEWMYDQYGYRQQFRANSNKIKPNNFEYIDVSFYILDNECLFLPLEIKKVLKEYLEPLYIKPYFANSRKCHEGRKAFVTFFIYKQNEWIVFAKSFINHFCNEYESECLNEYLYQNISYCIGNDTEINQRFEVYMDCFNVYVLSPDFDSMDEYNVFIEKQNEKRETKQKEDEKQKSKEIKQNKICEKSISLFCTCCEKYLLCSLFSKNQKKKRNENTRKCRECIKQNEMKRKEIQKKKRKLDGMNDFDSDGMQIKRIKFSK
eukprot:355240_1